MGDHTFEPHSSACALHVAQLAGRKRGHAESLGSRARSCVLPALTLAVHGIWASGTSLGADSAAATRNFDEFVTELKSLPEGWPLLGVVAAVAALIWAVIWMYRHEGRSGASLRARTLLALVRCSVLVTLAVILLEPVRVRIQRRWIDSYTLLLIDSSSSMDLSDNYRDPAAAARLAALNASRSKPLSRRADLVQEVLHRDDARFLNGLAANNRVRLYSFSDELHSLGMIRAQHETSTGSSGSGPSDPVWSPNEVPASFSATGPSTNIERAIRRAVDSLDGAPVAAIVVLSDGGFNQGATVEEVARFARERNIPVHTIGIGDPSLPRNVRITEILAPPNAFQQDPFAVSGRLVAEGFDGERIRVELVERNATEGGEGRVVAGREVPVAAGGIVEPITFQHRQSRAGRYVYSVEVPVLPEESVADDNGRQTPVNVIESRTKALLIAGGPSWDYQFVTHLLERDDTFDVSCWLQSADVAAVRDGDVVIDHLPATPEELFAYDVILLMDPEPGEFSEDWCRLVDRFVTEYGGGLLFIAGKPNTARLMRDPNVKSVRDLLPVTPDPEAELVLNRIGYYQLGGSHVEIPDASIAHPVLQLAEDPVSTKLVWQAMDDLHWHYPVLREKPAATVLLRHADPRMRNSYGGHVIAAVQFAGSGRSAFLAFNDTFRWRRRSEAMFNRFWVQMVRFLAEGKLLGGGKRGMLLTDKDQFNIGEAVAVSARLYDARFEPLTREQMSAEVSVEHDRNSFVLQARADRPGWYEGRFVPDRMGNYRISLLVPESSLPGAVDRSELELVREIRVTRPNLEILRPQMDRASLSALAERSSGGRYFEMDEAAALPAVIPDLHEEISVRSSPTSLWDNASLLAFLIALLSVEWAVRKWRHLL